jgi:hypothetical protein
MLCVASPSPARGDDDDDRRLARRLLDAGEKYLGLKEVEARYGRRAELAQAIFEKEQQRAELHTQVRSMNIEIGGWYQNRRLWLSEQWSYFRLKQEHEKQLNQLDSEIRQLKFEEKRMYEEALQEARASGKPIKPIAREALIGEIQRMEGEKDAAVGGLKREIEDTARKLRTTRRQVLDQAVAKLSSIRLAPPPPEVERVFLPRFIKYAGGEDWLDAGNEPPAARADPPRKPPAAKADLQKKPPAAKTKTAPSRTKKTGARSEVAAS